MLKPNTTYYIKARSISDQGESPDSNIIQVKTLASVENINITEVPPQPIINLNIEKNIITIEHINNNVSTLFYKLEISTLSDFSNIVFSINLENKKENIITLGYNTQYYYRLYGVNNIGLSQALIGNFTTNSKLEAPILRGATDITAINARLFWSKVKDATNYRIDISPNRDFTTLLINQQNTGNVDNFNFNSLSQNFLYYARIRAVSTTEVSPYSNIIAFKTLDNTQTNNNFEYIDINIRNIKIIEKGTDFVTLIWSDDFEEYEYDLSSNDTFSNIIQTDTIKNNSIKLKNLIIDTRYYFRIKGINTNSRSNQYTTIEITTLNTSQTYIPPFLINATNITTSSFNIFWQKRNYASNYILEISENTLFNNSEKIFLDNKDSYKGLNLKNNTNYFVRLYGIDILNNLISRESNTISFTTANNTNPIVLNSHVIQEFNNILLSWNSNSFYDSYSITIEDDTNNILGFYDNYNVGFTDNYLVSFFLKQGVTYKYKINGIKNNNIYSSATSEFTTPLKSPNLFIDRQAQNITWDGMVNKIEILENPEGIYKEGYPCSPIFETTYKLPKDSKYVRVYYEDGNIFSYKSKIISILEMNFIQVIKLTNNTIEIKLNDKDYYDIQLLENNIVMNSFVYPIRIYTSSYTIDNLTPNTNYEIIILNYGSLQFKTFNFNNPINNNNNFNINDLQIVGKTFDSVGLKLNPNKIYKIKYSDNSNFLWFNEFYTSNINCSITDLDSNKLYYFEIQSIVNNTISNPYTFTVTTNSYTSPQNITAITPVLFSPIVRNGEQYEFTFSFLTDVSFINLEVSNNNTFNNLIKVDYLPLEKFKKFIVFNLGSGNYFFRIKVANGGYFSRYSNTINLNLA